MGCWHPKTFHICLHPDSQLGLALNPHTAQGPELLIPPHLEVVHIAYTQGGPFPGVFLFTGMARMVRPVLHNGLASPELIGSLEQSTLDIRCWPLLQIVPDEG